MDTQLSFTWEIESIKPKYIPDIMIHHVNIIKPEYKKWFNKKGLKKQYYNEINVLISKTNNKPQI